MAFAVTSYSEAPFSAENPNVIAFAPSFELTAQQNSVVAKADVVAFPTGQSLTPIAGTANGSAFVQIDLIGSDLSIDLGDTSESFTDADADVTGQELTIVNKSFFQDTLLSFSEAPFATQNSDLISPSNIVIVSNNADVTPISFNLSANLGTATLLAATEGFATGFDLTMQENDPDSVTGDANISLTAFCISSESSKFSKVFIFLLDLFVKIQITRVKTLNNIVIKLLFIIYIYIYIYIYI